MMCIGRGNGFLLNTPEGSIIAQIKYCFNYQMIYVYINYGNLSNFKVFNIRCLCLNFTTVHYIYIIFIFIFNPSIAKKTQEIDSRTGACLVYLHARDVADANIQRPSVRRRRRRIRQDAPKNVDDRRRRIMEIDGRAYVCVREPASYRSLVRLLLRFM